MCLNVSTLFKQNQEGAKVTVDQHLPNLTVFEMQKYTQGCHLSVNRFLASHLQKPCFNCYVKSYNIALNVTVHWVL